MNFDLDIARMRAHESLRPAIHMFEKVQQKLQRCMKFISKNSINKVETLDSETNGRSMVDYSDSNWATNLDKQLQVWHENPHWVQRPSQIMVSVPKGSLCNLHVKVEVGLPPDAVYNIVIDPNNKRVFKNIKEVISRKVLVDEGSRQVVELEQAAIWRFLWFSGTISVHVIVEQNRENHSMNFKQGRAGFMKRFEGSWIVKPLFLDENLCLPLKPKTLEEYNLCTGGRGRVGSIVNLEQLVQPAIIPPPPVSWYLRGITAKTTEMLINDLLIEAARIRGVSANSDNSTTKSSLVDSSAVIAAKPDEIIKTRWKDRRKIRGKSKFVSCSTSSE